MKKLTYILIMLTSILALGFTFSYLPLKVDARDDLTEEDKAVTLNILTYNEEIYNLVKILVGDKHNITYIVESKISSTNINLEKDYKEDILNADLFIYNGFENNDLIKDINKLVDTSKTNSINISRGVRPVINNYDLENNENPNYLLGINEYKIALYNIKVALQEKDFDNREYYEEKYNDISSEIDEVIIKSTEEISKYNDYLILTNTEKFDYLFRDLELKVKKIEDKDDISELEEKNIIFIYDNYNGLEEVKKEIDFKCNYIGLDNSNEYNTLLNNINLIIEGIKTSSNS